MQIFFTFNLKFHYILVLNALNLNKFMINFLITNLIIYFLIFTININNFHFN